MPAFPLLALALIPQGTPVTMPKLQGQDDPPLTVSKSITLDGAAMPYSATFGLMPLKDEKGEVEIRMSYTAYAKTGADSSRPLLFAYNGGPGSASLWLHLGTIGPRRVVLNDDGTMPKPPFKLADNEDTWLKEADVVLIDAPSTGAGRVAKPEYGSRFFGVQEDLRAFTRFITSYLTQYNRWQSPIYLSGESYGGVRTAGLAKSLLSSGVGLTGAIVVSGTMNFSTLDGGAGNDLPYTGFFPTYAQVAWYHKKLSPAWEAKPVEEVAKAAEAFASGPYEAALFKGTSISPAEEKSVIAKYSELTGLSQDFVKRSNLRVPEWHFFKELLRDKGETVGRYDARLIGRDQDDAGEGPEYDASDAAVEAPFATAMQQLLTGDFGWKSDTPYRTWGDIGHWKSPEGGYTDTSEDLRQAMAQNPHFRIRFECGRYDLACPYFATQYTVNHMGLRPEQASRVDWRYYPSGHMIYIEKNSRAALAKDVAEFIRETK